MQIHRYMDMSYGHQTRSTNYRRHLILLNAHTTENDSGYHGATVAVMTSL